MRSLVTSAVVALSFALAGSAGAADLYNNSGSSKDAPSASFLPFGFYVSAGVGGSFTDTNVAIDKINPADFSFGGFDGEARFGADYRIPNTSWIVGGFAGVNYDGFGGKVKTTSYTPSSLTASNYAPASITLSGSALPLPTGFSPIAPSTVTNALANGGSVPAGTTIFLAQKTTYTPASYTSEVYTPSSYSTGYVDAEQGWGYEAGLRVGRVFNNTALLYGLVAWQGQNLSLKDTGSSTLLNGIKLGAGLEIDLTNHWFFGSEIDWIDYGNWNVTNVSNGAVTVSETELKATARLGYRF